MANPQKEKGHLRIANELVEAFQWLHLSGNQWRLLWTILRFTYGWNKKADHISLTSFEKCTGIDRRNLKRDLDVLFFREIIIKDNSSYITKYGLQKDYTKWQTGVKNNTSVKNDTRTSVENNTKTSVKNYTHKRQKTIKNIFDPNSDEIRMSELLFSLICQRHTGHKKPDFQKWLFFPWAAFSLRGVGSPSRRPRVSACLSRSIGATYSHVRLGENPCPPSRALRRGGRACAALPREKIPHF